MVKTQNFCVGEKAPEKILLLLLRGWVGIQAKLISPLLPP
jgi:hypothetical protein